MSESEYTEINPDAQPLVVEAMHYTPRRRTPWTAEELAVITGRLVILRLLDCDYDTDWKVRRITHEARTACSHARRALEGR